MKIAVVCVPFIRYDHHELYALQTILSLKGQETDHDLDLIAIVNEFRSDPDDSLWIEKNFAYCELNDVNNLSRAWNKGINRAFERGADYVLLVNLDVVLHSRCIENLVSFYKEHPDAFLISPGEWADKDSLESALLGDQVQKGSASFSCFMIDKKLPQLIGPFDEQFGPAYHEDADMSYRLKLAQSPYYRTHSALFWHVDRGTLKAAVANNDEKFLATLRVAMDESMVRYEAKWGGLPGNEQFKTPYRK